MVIGLFDIPLLLYYSINGLEHPLNVPFNFIYFFLFKKYFDEMLLSLTTLIKPYNFD